VRQFVPVDAILAERRGMPLLRRCAIVGATSGTVIGAIAGLILGIHANPATAWFAVFEVGIPAGITGGLAGALAALMVTAGRRIKRASIPSP
jgi:hypothetical protein